MSEYFRPWNIDQTLLLPPNVHLKALGALFLQVLKLCETAGGSNSATWRWMARRSKPTRRNKSDEL
jgi:hypothetical protein